MEKGKQPPSCWCFGNGAVPAVSPHSPGSLPLPQLPPGRPPEASDSPSLLRQHRPTPGVGSRRWLEAGIFNKKTEKQEVGREDTKRYPREHRCPPPPHNPTAGPGGCRHPGRAPGPFACPRPLQQPHPRLTAPPARPPVRLPVCPSFLPSVRSPSGPGPARPRCS